MRQVRVYKHDYAGGASITAAIKDIDVNKSEVLAIAVDASAEWSDGYDYRFLHVEYHYDVHETRKNELVKGCADAIYLARTLGSEIEICGWTVNPRGLAHKNDDKDSERFVGSDGTELACNIVHRELCNR